MRIEKENSFFCLVVVHIRSDIGQKTNTSCMQAWVCKEKSVLKEVHRSPLCRICLASFVKGFTKTESVREPTTTLSITGCHYCLMYSDDGGSSIPSFNRPHK